MSEARPNSVSNTGSGTTTSVRTSLPQVQVIHQPVHSPPYLPQFPYNQQQLMLQNAAVQAAMQAGAMNQQLNMAMQGRPPPASPKSPGVMSPSPTAVVTSVSSAPVSVSSALSSSAQISQGSCKAAANGNKNVVTSVTSQGQATPLIGGKPVMPTQAAPLLVGQIGVLPGQSASSPAFVSQTKTQTVSVGHTAQPQLINSQSPLRMNSQSQLVASGGQIITSQPMLTNHAVLQAMASLQQGIPLAHQPLLASQSPTILAGQPLYIRTTGPLQSQQGMVAAPANMQSVNPIKNNKLMDMPTSLQGKNVNINASKHCQGNKGLSAILPSTSKTSSATAKIHPTNLTMQQHAGAKLNIPTITPKQSTKVRTKQSKIHPAAAVTHNKPSTPTSLSKPATPTNQANGAAIVPKSQSDSEVETGRKTAMLESKENKNSTEPSNKAPAEEKQETRRCADTPKPPTVVEERKEEPMDVAEKPSLHSKQSEPVVEKQKAIVKPHILTHVIEGFIIQEGPEPFPVQRSSLLTEFIPPKPSSHMEKDSELEENGSAHDFDLTLGEDYDDQDQPPTLKCEFCGKIDLESKFRRSKRFCSMACAKRYNVGCSRRLGLFKPKTLHVSQGNPVEKRVTSGSGSKYVKKRKHVLKMRKGWRPGRGGRLAYNINTRLPPEEPSSSHSSQESSSSPTSPAPPADYDINMETPRAHPTKWTVQDVYDFIRSMPGCATYAEEFRAQEIDGQALLLLKEDHLMTAMNMKLGPALKICARINSLKDTF